MLASWALVELNSQTSCHALKGCPGAFDPGRQSTSECLFAEFERGLKEVEFEWSPLHDSVGLIFENNQIKKEKGLL